MAEYELITYNGHNEKYKGRKVRLYADGTIKNERGHWIERPAGSAGLITHENARSRALMRQEKTADKLRQAIIEAHNASMPAPVGTSSDAFAMSGAMLYETIVLDPERYPRDRMEAWEKLGRYADVLPADIRAAGKGGQEPGITMSEGVASQLLDLLNGLTRQDVDVIEGKAE